jgi:hypothetical protein
MSFWDYLRKVVKQGKASEKVDELGKLVMDEAHWIGEKQRQLNKTGKV